MLSIQQKVFQLCCESGRPLGKHDKLLIIVNGTVLQKEASVLFKKYEQKPNSIKGYSILSNFNLTDYKLVNKETSIAFFNDTTKEIILTKEIRNPVIQMNNKTFTDDEIQEFITNITVPVSEEQQPDEEKKGAYSKEIEKLVSEGYKEYKFSIDNTNLSLINSSEDSYLVELLDNDFFNNIEMEINKDNTFTFQINGEEKTIKIENENVVVVKSNIIKIPKQA